MNHQDLLQVQLALEEEQLREQPMELVASDPMGLIIRPLYFPLCFLLVGEHLPFSLHLSFQVQVIFLQMTPLICFPILLRVDLKACLQ